MTECGAQGKSGPLRQAFFIISCAFCFYLVMLPPCSASDGDLTLNELISDAVKKNPDILAAEARAEASGFRVPQSGSLPDPMIMFGYQNEGWKKYTYREMQGAQWMFTASQMLPYPGKLGIKTEMAGRDAEAKKAMADAVRLQVIARIKGLYYDLFLSYKNIDLLKERSALFDRIEDAAVARYSSGMGLQQEILMAQTEKYMLLEREEMQRQKIQASEAMLNAAAGRDAALPVGKPGELTASAKRSVEELLAIAYSNSPEIRAKEKMVAAAQVKVEMVKKEYYPDVTINAGYANRGGGQLPDMWSLTTSINIPLFYKTKQRQAVLESEAELLAARHELDAARLMVSSGVLENYSMIRASERLIELYSAGLIPKAYQDFESAIAGYSSGRTEAVTVINRLKTLIELETSYWGQRVEIEKAMARCEAAAGINPREPEVQR